MLYRLHFKNGKEAMFSDSQEGGKKATKKFQRNLNKVVAKQKKASEFRESGNTA